MDDLVEAKADVAAEVDSFEIVDLLSVSVADLDADVRMWLMLNNIAKACGNPHAALRSLLWYEVMSICVKRFDFFKVMEDGNLRRK